MGGIKKIGSITVIQLSDIDSNIFKIGDTVIDSGTGFNFTRLYQVLKMLKIQLKDIKHIVNTHCHFDHIGGNGYFIEADVAIHEQDAEVVEKADAKKSYADFFDGKLKPREVNIRLKEGDKVSVGGMDLEVIHTPGHTPGSICLYDRSGRILFTGDTVFSDGIGRTDMPGGSDQHLQSSLEKISKLEVKTLLPGHGNSLSLESPRILGEIISGPPEAESGE
jgi:glyoxylase-like metal-dependent hydrolase (beta-lactamase superfamily II)